MPSIPTPWNSLHDISKAVQNNFLDVIVLVINQLTVFPYITECQEAPAIYNVAQTGPL